ncbi:MAG: TetR family transcriptional regulator [Fermentimonas sp.]|nr:TetR family transcriptional regulator [Fermentimonas sp.]MDD3189902.1 TetR family transcriptional regulator [Fermentimonas sp.]MDD4283385.1 TetR family transcriptional regulator [Fermentimonas sp.]
MDKVTTEQKIISAADNLFTQKGYAATKTREIADEAGVNLALVNYYFGSKENLYKKVVQKKFRMLLGAISPVLSDENISIEDKITSITDNYTKLLLENEELPIFILNELTVNKELFKDITENARLVAQPVIDNQLKERNIEMSAADLIVNTLGLTMFPFVAKPLIVSSGLVKEEEFVSFVSERSGKILEWIIKTTK